MVGHMKRRAVGIFLILVVSMTIMPPCVTNAKTIKKIPDGAYIISFKTCRIKDRKLIVKGNAVNWVRSMNTPEYSKSGIFKFKLKRKCEILDGYRETTETISIKSFNRLCKKHDGLHGSILITVTKNKVSLIRFW